MSTFVDNAINPETGKSQLALFIDDYYGPHQYGVGFKENGTDASLYDMANKDSGYTVYPIDEITTESDEQRRKL